MTDTTTMQAGRELDALIATRVMGKIARHIEVDEQWRCADNWYLGDADLITEIEAYRGVGGYDEYILPAYSIDIAAAYQVMEHLRAQWPQASGSPARYWQIVSNRDGTWSVAIREENAGITATRLLARHVDVSLPFAICRAALEVLD